MAEQRAKAGDRVRLDVATRTLRDGRRGERTVPRGTTGLVERSAGSILRVVVSDAPDDRTDVVLVSAYSCTLITEPE